jgi:AraC family transcriptional regulator
MSTTSTTGGTGHFVPWDGGCVLIGRSAGIIPPHAHYAIQITFGADHGVRFRSRETDVWTEYGGAIIPSRHPHSMDATHVRAAAVLLVEPETREGRALTERYLQGGIAALPDDLLADVRAPLYAAWEEQRDRDAVAAAGQRAIRLLAGGVMPMVVSDERILRAIAYIKAHLDAPLTLDPVANEACLSPSRFRHLFVEETGTALRPYILWRRFLRVWELVMAGQSLSTAAHAAGFADAAHLSRTSKTMFGFPPSAIHIAPPLANPAPSFNPSTNARPKVRLTTTAARDSAGRYPDHRDVGTPTPSSPRIP